ncbi:MAG: RluA family pseudouridine synthase [Lactococcus sp.]|nr:RluA family pseudouridine synthase [Lactococcus sp.]SOB46931.1 pseudouridylate synthase [Lactococcus piscium]MDN5403708.1 RluA family pseudouridine synthase [Lactococcus sp.]MDN5409442.1 RluA family pseudouridine synthase [Lactococcus sp.]MDN5412836.1 RluA family pseudouridine synthase [Lactococcus sp.]MDN5436826.1 RluA family pseudouridine synthase [Lactococcus sp.]
MRFTFQATQDGVLLKTLLKQQGISKKLLAKIKFDGGQLLVNGIRENAIFKLAKNDQVIVDIPSEHATPTLVQQEMTLTIVYEDDHLLVIDKPAGIASVTGQNYPDKTMSNFVAGYLKAQGYDNQKVHVVTRLDKDTSGLMLFAKHGYAHSRMDKLLQQKGLTKRYYALVHTSTQLLASGEIKVPIGRKDGSIIERAVVDQQHPTAKYAHTSYQTVASHAQFTLVDIQLHTGRTHQIRVHFAYLGAPLLGDDLYGGSRDQILRQALHCHTLSFCHPFSGELINLEASLPKDMARLL